MNRNFYIITTIAVLIVVAGGLLFADDKLMDITKKAAEKAVALSKSRAEPKPDGPQQQADALQLKINALNSLNKMLSDERVKANARMKMMQDYLQFLGKMKNYETSDLANAKTKSVMTFDHAVSTAIEHEKTKPPVNVAHVDDAEIVLLKRVESATETLSKKMWDDVTAAHDQASCIAGYLKSIDKLNGYDKWAGIEVEKQKQAADAKRKEKRASAVATEKQKLKDEQLRRQKRYAEMHQEHLTNMQRKFELTRQKMQEDAAYKIAPRQRNVSWHGWNDPYNDIYHR
jgi:hypothetical protein